MNVFALPSLKHTVVIPKMSSIHFVPKFFRLGLGASGVSLRHMEFFFLSE